MVEKELEGQDLTQENKENQLSYEDLIKKHEELKKSYTYSSQEGYKQKEINKVYKDNNYVLELYKKNPKLAEEILKDEW
jgi:hypothetical protein